MLPNEDLALIKSKIFADNLLYCIYLMLEKTKTFIKSLKLMKNPVCRNKTKWRQNDLHIFCRKKTGPKQKGDEMTCYKGEVEVYDSPSVANFTESSFSETNTKESR